MGYPFILDAAEINNFNASLDYYEPLNKDTKYYMLTNKFYDDLIKKKQPQSHKAKYLKYKKKYIQLKKLQQY